MSTEHNPNASIAPPAPITANATFCATLVDEWIRQGLTAAFIAPGSRSTPLALALVDRSTLVGGPIAVHIFHDERSAAFAALGHGLATETPGVVLCSSGTAGTHFHAAVVEAGLSCVPMLVCTADRPPELWGRGAPQVIDQTDLFGGAVRAFAEPGPPDDGDPTSWRPLAAITWSAATDTQPGPVHLNLSFRDPLAGRADELPPPDDALLADDVEHPTIEPSDASELATMVAGKSGVIVAGRGQSSVDAVTELAGRLGWVVLADHRSGLRTNGAVRHFDSLLRDRAFAEQQRPDVILRLGEIVSSKALSQWISASAGAGSTVIAARPWGRLIDPEDVATSLPIEHGLIEALLAEIDAGTTPSAATIATRDRWVEANAAAETAIAQALADVSPDRATDPVVAQSAIAAPPAGGALVVASSMPVRDVEWFGQNRGDITVYSNRGANGIDGTVATAIGIAATGTPTVCLIGDVALLHDSTSLIGLADRSIDLTIVVTDNDGGGIFSFLPQHDLLDAERYELLFGTPHGTDLAALAGAHSIRCSPWTEAIPVDGVRIVIATTDRAENLELHRHLVATVAATLQPPK